MAQIELVMPKMGESIVEATILKWIKQVGDTVEEDETILEIATDKVDSEVPSPVSGTIAKILFEENDVVEIGKVLAIIATEGETIIDAVPAQTSNISAPNGTGNIKKTAPVLVPTMSSVGTPVQNSTGRFYSPLVKSIAKKENISQSELDAVSGSGKDGRVTKKDILAYLTNKPTGSAPKVETKKVASAPKPYKLGANEEIVEMDRIRKLISNHMIESKKTSAHITSMVEVDVTDLVNWRNSVKNGFLKKFGQKITFTPIFMEAVAKAITDMPMINVSVNGYDIIVKKNINLGMATSLPTGNLIVPVIKNADQLNLLGMTKAVNDLATRARANKLKPDEIQGGTFTVTNVGTFGNVMGTAVINQPQVAILAVGAIRKKPGVIETAQGDFIGIRHMMFLSLTYDHRVVDGALGGAFVRKIGDILENFDATQSF